MPEFDSTTVYRPINGYSRYMVGSDGSVWSKCCHGGFLKNERPWHQMRSMSVNGYLRVMLRDGKKEWRWVHHLVLEAFVGPRMPGMETRHLDGDKTNNQLSNLAWGTRSENYQDKVRHGVHNRGSRNHFSKLNESQVQEIRRLRASGVPAKEIASMFGVGKQIIWLIATKKKWKHLGSEI